MLPLSSITVSCLLVLQNQLPYDKISFMMNHDEVNHIENLKSTRVFQQYGSPTRPLELRYFHAKGLKKTKDQH